MKMFGLALITLGSLLFAWMFMFGENWNWMFY